MTEFITKDSGEREEFDSGMKRDTEKGKPRFDLIVPRGVPYEEQLLTRFAALMGRGADKYGDRNWEKGDSAAEIERAKSSAFRHFFQWLTGERDEDHAVAVIFNMMVVETTEWKMADSLKEYRPRYIMNPGVDDPIESPSASVVQETIDRLEGRRGGFAGGGVQQAIARRDSTNIPTEDLRM